MDFGGQRPVDRWREVELGAGLKLAVSEERNGNESAEGGKDMRGP
jgi:hypothetical protein